MVCFSFALGAFVLSRHHLRAADLVDKRVTTGLLHRASLAGRKRQRRGQALGLANGRNDLIVRLPPGSLAWHLVPLAKPPLCRWPVAFTRSLETLRSAVFGNGVTIGLVAVEHHPADHGQLPRRRHHGHVAGLLLQQSAEEVAQGPRVLVQMLCGLDEHPTSLAVAPFGDRAMMTALCRLLRGRCQAQVTGGMIAVGKALRVAPGGEQRLGRGHVHARQGHQELHRIAGMASPGQFRVEGRDLLLQVFQLLEVAVDEQAALGVELHGGQPVEASEEKSILNGTSISRTANTA